MAPSMPVAGQNRRLAVILIILLLILGALLYLYWLMTKPPTPVKGGPAKGITPLFSIYGFGKQRFNSPNGVAVDSSGNIYVADTGRHRVVVFNRSGRYLFRFGSEKVKNKGVRLLRGQLLLPLNVAVAGNGDIYVSSLAASKVSVFNKRGKFKNEFKADRPIKLLISGKKLYITTPGQIWITDLRGKIMQRWGTKGRRLRQFEFPNGVALDKKGNLFVSDSQNMRIQIFNKKGELIGGVGKPPANMNDSKRLFGLGLGLVLDEQQRVFVADALRHAVRVFTYDGEDLGEYGDQGSNEGRFNYPSDIAYMGGGVFAVADKWNDRVQVLRITPKLSEQEEKEAASSRPWRILMIVAGLLLLLLILALVIYRYYGARNRQQRAKAA